MYHFKDLAVDAGMIGIVPVAAIDRTDEDGLWKEGGMVFKVLGGLFLSLRYDDGRITITADEDECEGAMAVPVDTEFWIGDPCYVLTYNLPANDRDWDKAENPEPGYWAACLRSFETPRFGEWVGRPYELPGGMQGLVSRTQWGDGLYPAEARTLADYLLNVVIMTGDEYEEEEEE
ncbi:MAG: hypothetical protein DCC51_14655 [Anaerolineae bacterium]|nr:MAG: hypothetical protein DCC51_14655 [Anaerolineae bacterium]